MKQDHMPILIMGRIGNKIEIAYTLKRVAICKFAVAETIEGVPEPRWYQLVVEGRQAEVCSAQLEKGKLIFVQGQKREREYTNKEGVIKKYQELRASFVGTTLMN